ncbi:MAG: DUF4340 domain-containing protein [Anaerolineales bacterium]|nr:DUF4340 domain-containing protein [Anaerolineales bacterium]
MIKRSTIIVLIVLAILISAYFIVKNRPVELEELEPSPTALGVNFLVSAQDGRLISIRIEDTRSNIVLLRRATTGLWTLVLPSTSAVDQALAGAAETQILSLAIVSPLDTIPDLDVVGLTTPTYVIELEFDSGVTHLIQVGQPSATGSGYYVKLDNDAVYVVRKAGIEALANLLVAPPYPATATPAPPTSTPAEEPATATVESMPEGAPEESPTASVEATPAGTLDTTPTAIP